MKFTSFYLSRILGGKIYSEDKNVIGKLIDIGVDTSSSKPKAAAAKIKTSEGIKNISWEGIEVAKNDGQYKLICSNIAESKNESLLFLRKHVLDKQIIDINGRKVVRVNDIRLVVLNRQTYLIAVDIGTEGLFRRLGAAKPLKRIGIKLSSKLMLWDEIETVVSSSESLKLGKTYNRLSTLHPSDLADIIERLDARTGMSILTSFDNAKAADVLEQMEEDAQVSMIRDLTSAKAADILEEMPADEVADILDGLYEDKAEELLNSMEKGSNEVRNLMEYDDDEVGSLMNKDYVSFEASMRVEYVISSLRNMKPEEEKVYSIYVVDKNKRLVGTVSLRDIIISDPQETLKTIMRKDSIYVFDADRIDDMIMKVSKYNLFSIPVVNKYMILTGNVIINDIIYELLKSRRRLG